MGKPASCEHTYAMRHHILIDGNNLLHAMHGAGLIRNSTRAALLRAIEPWARGVDDDVTLVFDGSPPAEGFRKTVSSKYMQVLFSVGQTADDIIVRMVHEARHPETLRVVSSDKAIAYEARRRRCKDVSCADFMRELVPTADTEPPPAPQQPEKPQRALSKEETDTWLSTFGLDQDEEPFDGYSDMQGP